MKLYLLRHGETDWNVLWKMQGATDIPLNETGISQAQTAAIRLKDVPFDAVYSSPLIRARKTAEIINEPHGLEIIVDERIREMCFGIYEGTTPEETKDDVNRSNLFNDPENYIPMGGAESYDEVRARCTDFLSDLKTSGHDVVLVCAHGALVQVMNCVINNKPIDKEFWKLGPPKNCEPMVLDFN